MFASLKKKHYRVVALVPPWRFSAGTERRPQHYPRMRDKEIAAMPLASLAHPEGCWFFVWITSPIDGPRFWEGVWPGWKAQGIRYSGRAFVWVKDKVGMGYTTRKSAEDVLLFKIGHPARVARDVQEAIHAPRGRHSEKPEEVFLRIERFCDGPRVELFSRKSRPGWSAWGNEVGLLDGDK